MFRDHGSATAFPLGSPLSQRPPPRAGPLFARASPLNERTAFACTSAASLLGALGLLGWVTPWRWLARLDLASIPMAPSTALALLLLGGSLALEARAPSGRLAAAVSVLVCLFASGQVATVFTHVPSIVDVMLVPAPELVSGVPMGRMSPWSALGLLAAGVSVLLSRLAGRGRAIANLAALLALAVCALGAIVTLGYLFDAPLLYSGGVVPVAFSTGLALDCLGLALVAATPRDIGPVRSFVGPGSRASLLRAFLPVAPTIVLVELLFDHVKFLSATLDSALTSLVSATAVAAVVSYTARSVSRELDRSRGDVDRLAAIVQSSSDAIYAKDMDGAMVVWNPSAERLFGYTQEEVLGQPALILAPGGAEPEPTGIEGTISVGPDLGTQEVNRLRKDGSLVLMTLSESTLRNADGQVVGASVIARDVSEQRSAERAQVESEERFRQIAENIQQVFWLADSASEELLYVSPAYQEIWRPDRGRIPASTTAWMETVHPQDQGRVRAAKRASRTSGQYSEEYRIVRPDGSLRWIWDRAFAIRDGAGRVSRVAGLAEDISDRKRAADELRESERRFSSMLANIHLLSLMLSIESRITYCNDYLLTLTGWKREEVLGANWPELFLPPEDLATRSVFSDLLANAPAAWHHENEILTRGGARRLIRWNNSLLRSPTGDVVGTSSIGEDITEHRRTQEQLLQSQKMEAVGRLAGGVAHDFNNSLGVILGYTEILMLQATAAQQGKLQQVLNATHRAAGLTRQLLAFSRKQIVDPKVLDLNALLAALQKMLGRLIGEHIDLTIVPGAGLGQVRADRGQLEQVVMNLCVNARDAMPDGGLLRVETSNVEMDGAHAARHEPIAPGRYVRLAISDAGSGMDEGVLSKIFEPFFTTKEQGKGTGLGLAMVYGIVKQAGGYIWIDSEPGRGTVFQIFLPRVDEAVTQELPEEPTPPMGSETILLVEDEGSLREIAREILEGHGYRVVEAGSPLEAIEIAGNHPDPIHLLVTDVVMPGMNGRALAECLLAQRPALKVLYMSGYTDDVIAHSGVLESGTLLLEKPFASRALLTRVCEALEA